MALPFLEVFKRCLNLVLGDVLVVESCIWDGITLLTYTGWGLESSFTGVTLGVPVDKNWNMSQHCTLAVQKIISILGLF